MALFVAKFRELSPQHFAMFFFMLVTGLRPSSVRPLRRRGAECDVDWKNGRLRVRRSHTIGEEVIRPAHASPTRSCVPAIESGVTIALGAMLGAVSGALDARTGLGAAKGSISFGVVTALPKEFVAMEAMLEQAEEYVSPAGRVYAIGTVPAKGGGTHRVAVILGDQGTNAASYFATVLTEDFPEVYAVLMVGIAGAIPHPEKLERHVRLGDIVVSGEGGVVQYDFLKEHASHVEERFPPRPPDGRLLASAQRLQVGALKGKRPWMQFVARGAHLPDAKRPPVDDDRLAHTVNRDEWVEHPHDPRLPGEPRVFLGKVACANRLLKNPVLRDAIRDHYSAMAVEMEGSGVAEVTWHNTMGFMIVRGTCDYCDGNKGDAWQGHAAILAAAYARALLEETPPVPLREAMRQVRIAAPSDAALRDLGKRLLSAATPPSLLALFSDAAAEARAAIQALERVARIVSSSSSSSSTKKSVRELFDAEGHHLVLGAPGSGKTFALWHAASECLDGASAIPLYLPMSTFDSWAEAEATIRSAAGAVDLDATLSDQRVRVVLDGWTEFAAAHPTEVSPCMRRLASSRVLANGRSGNTADSRFTPWDLEHLSTTAIHDTLRAVFPSQVTPSGALDELLRLPLALALHILRGGAVVLPGELLANMHRHLSDGMPSSFDAILCGAVASVELEGGTRSTKRLRNEIRERANAAGLANAEQLLEQLGTLDVRRSAVVPLHDLYWSWLAGRGILNESRVEEALGNLSTRECIELALQSDEPVAPRFTDAARTNDIVLAERLVTSEKRGTDARRRLQEQLDRMLLNARLPVRSRAALAALHSENESLIRRALKVITELRDAGVYLPVFEATLRPEHLFPYRGVVAEWVGSHGSDLIVDAVAKRGGPEWAPWVQQLAHDGKISEACAVGTLLACEGRLTTWTTERLELVFENRRETHRLRAAAARGTNLELARWLAERFEKFMGEGDSRFLELRNVFVGCGDDRVFARLLERFPTVPPQAQTQLGYTITARGEPWLARFQRVALSSCHEADHHELLAAPSSEIDDATARSWIDAGYGELGWRVLASRGDGDIAEQLVRALPMSFDGVVSSASLSAMRYLKNPPTTLIDEIWSRLRGTIHPKLMEQVLYALSSDRARGVPSMVAQLSRAPSFLPTYHLMRFLQLLQSWERETSLQLRVAAGDQDIGFLEWVLDRRLRAEPTDAFLRLHLRSFGSRIVPTLLKRFEAGDSTVVELIKTAGAVSSFHQGLVDHLFSSGESGSIPTLFAECLDTFPEAVLLRLIEMPTVDDRVLGRALADRPSPSHAHAHAALVKRALAKPIDIWLLRDLARLFRVYPKETLAGMLESVCVQSGDRIWFIREVEVATGQLLLNENAEWRNGLS